MMLELKNVTKNFKGLCAVSQVTASMEEGEIIGLIGPNGAGKTTLFNMISGFDHASTGMVAFQGENITKMNPNQICKLGIGRTFQITKPFMDITVLDTVTIGALNRENSVSEAKKTAREIIELVGLMPNIDFLGANLNVAQRKRVELARALATKPKLLLLDEVVAGLNPSEVNEMILLLQKIAKSGVSIIIVEHILKVLTTLCDRILVLHHGELILEEKPDSLLENQKFNEVYLGGGAAC